MKLAIPTRGTVVDDHFGHCEMYSVFTFNESKEIIGKETVPSPQGCGCKSNIASVLSEMGVTLLLAGNMGEGAKKVLNKHQIDVIRGCKGDIDELTANFLQGKIGDSGEGCHQHEEHGADHVCSH